MDDNFNFMDQDILSESVDQVASYFKIRQGVRESFKTTNFDSSVSLLSLDRGSLLNGPVESDQVFTKLESENKLMLNNLSSQKKDLPSNAVLAEIAKMDDIMSKANANSLTVLNVQHEKYVETSNVSACQTPKAFYNALHSLVPETPHFVLPKPAAADTYSSVMDCVSLDFSVRKSSDAIKKLDRDQKNFVANHSGLSINSDFSLASGPFPDQNLKDGLGKTEGRCSDSIAGYFKEKRNSLGSIVGAFKEEISGRISTSCSTIEDPKDETELDDNIKAIQAMLSKGLDGTLFYNEMIRKQASDNGYLEWEQKRQTAVGGAAHDGALCESTPFVATRHVTPHRRRRNNEEQPRMPLQFDSSNLQNTAVVNNDTLCGQSDNIPNIDCGGDSIVDKLDARFLERFSCLSTGQFVLNPVDSFIFGTIPRQCKEIKTFNISYKGCNDAVLNVVLHNEGEYPSFFIESKPIFHETSILQANDIVWSESSFQVPLRGNIEQNLSFNVSFQPSVVPVSQENQFMELGGKVIAKIEITGSDREPMIAQTSLRGVAAFGRFLCRADSSPFILTTSSSAPAMRNFDVINVGAIPLLIGLHVADNESLAFTHAQDVNFAVPNKITLPVGGKESFPIKFTPRVGDVLIRKRLVFHFLPNGKTNFDVELVGHVRSSTHDIYTSATSVKSGSTISRDHFPVPVKLSSSNRALSWLATPLSSAHKPVQSFQIKVSSSQPTSVRIVIDNDSGVFKIINERGEALSRVRKILKPDTPLSVNVCFKPDSVGLHISKVSFQIASSEPSIVHLTGYGGCPKLRIENTLMDLNGNKMVKLAHPSNNSGVFFAEFQIINYGNAPGFVLITPDPYLLAVSQCFRIFPDQYVLDANSKVTVHLSQTLSRTEFNGLLSGHEIIKVASLNITLGDEPSRQRYQRFVKDGKSRVNETNKKLLSRFPEEKELNLSSVVESKDFEGQFLGSLVRSDVTVVLQKDQNRGEQTIIDLDETYGASFQTLSETVIYRPTEPTESAASVSADAATKKVHDWLGKIKD